eukprot:784858-Pyramimonas_sp.AAC.1
MSNELPTKRILSVSVKPGHAVVPIGWPMAASRTSADGSSQRNAFILYNIPGPPLRNAYDSLVAIIVGNACKGLWTEWQG